MDKKQFGYGFLFALGLFFVASYSIDNRGFHSGIYGIIGCLLILGSYVGLNWTKLKARDHHSLVIMSWLIGILALIIVLDILEVLLG